MPKAVVVPPDGPAVVKEIAGYEALKAELQGGWLEALTGRLIDAVAYIDEDGKGKGLPLNPVATRFARERIGLWPGDYIVGTLILLGTRNARGEIDGDDHAVPAWVVQELGIPE